MQMAIVLDSLLKGIWTQLLPLQQAQALLAWNLQKTASMALPIIQSNVISSKKDAVLLKLMVLVSTRDTWTSKWPLLNTIFNNTLECWISWEDSLSNKIPTTAMVDLTRVNAKHKSIFTQGLLKDGPCNVTQQLQPIETLSSIS